VGGLTDPPNSITANIFDSPKSSLGMNGFGFRRTEAARADGYGGVPGVGLRYPDWRSDNIDAIEFCRSWMLEYFELLAANLARGEAVRPATMLDIGFLGFIAEARGVLVLEVCVLSCTTLSRSENEYNEELDRLERKLSFA